MGMKKYLQREKYRIVYMNSAGFLECLVTDSLGKNNFCTNAVCDPDCKKIVEITKMQLTKLPKDDIIKSSKGREVTSMRMNKEVQKVVDAWYDDYCKKFGKTPTWSELIAKAAEVEKFLQNKG